MDQRQKVFFIIVSIYFIAVITGIAFLFFLFTGEWLRALAILFIELCLFYIGKNLKNKRFY